MNNKILLILISLTLLMSVICISSLNSVKADSVTVISSSGFTDSIGDYHIVGEVQNTGSNTVDYVQITATYYNTNNQVVDTQFSFASLSYMQPGAKSPFDIIETTSTLVPQISTNKLQVTSTTSGSITQGLEITSNSSYTDSIGDVHIVGQIQNTGSATSSATEIFATCYDSSGMVVDTGLTFANPQDISPGGTSPFEIIVTDSSQIPLITSYSLTAQSSDYALISANLPSATPTVTSSTPTATPTTPEFPSLAVLSLFMAISIIIVSCLRLESERGAKAEQKKL